MSAGQSNSLAWLNLTVAGLNDLLLPISSFLSYFMFRMSRPKGALFSGIEDFVLVVSLFCLPALNGLFCPGFLAWTALRRGDRAGQYLTMVIALVTLGLLLIASPALAQLLAQRSVYGTLLFFCPTLLPAFVYCSLALYVLSRRDDPTE